MNIRSCRSRLEESVLCLHMYSQIWNVVLWKQTYIEFIIIIISTSIIFVCQSLILRYKHKHRNVFMRKPKMNTKPEAEQKENKKFFCVFLVLRLIQDGWLRMKCFIYSHLCLVTLLLMLMMFFHLYLYYLRGIYPVYLGFMPNILL